ncbi:Translation initiation factor 1A, partial [Massospora cicadina]
MPKNKGKGGKNRRRGKNENDYMKRELILKDEGQEYAQVVKMLGNGRLEALSYDGTRRLALIRGKMRKKVWISQDNKADVIMKYTADEARALKSQGELPENGKSFWLILIVQHKLWKTPEGTKTTMLDLEFDSEADNTRPKPRKLILT